MSSLRIIISPLFTRQSYYVSQGWLCLRLPRKRDSITWAALSPLWHFTSSLLCYYGSSWSSLHLATLHYMSLSHEFHVTMATVDYPSCLLILDRLAKSHLCYHDNGLLTADNHLEFTSLSWQRIFSFRWCLLTNLMTTCDTLRRFPCATMTTNSSLPPCVSSQQTEFSHLQNGHCTYRWFHD